MLKLRLIDQLQGPRELMIFDPAAISTILGASYKLQKGPFYGATSPQSLHTTRDSVFHRKRRKIWDIAFKQCNRFSWVVCLV